MTPSAVIITDEQWDNHVSWLEHTVTGPRSAYIDLLFNGKLRTGRSIASTLVRRWALPRSKVMGILRLLTNKGMVRIGERSIEAIAYSAAEPSAFWLEGGSWRLQRQRVFERDGFACVYCGATEGVLHADHVHPRVRGGTDELANLVTACRGCNLSKGAKPLTEWKS